jgi:hypothetical protein
MKRKLFLSLFIATALSGCGSNNDSGSSVDIPSAAPIKAIASGLTYTDPTGTGDWRLVKDSSSTKTRIVLNLVGPDGLTVRGVGFNLHKGKCVSFAKFSDGAYAINTNVFELKGSDTNFEYFAGTEADPVLFVSGILKSGDVLSTGIFQKDRTRSAKSVTLPLVQVAVELPASGISCNAGDIIALNIPKSRIVAADNGGSGYDLTPEVKTKAVMTDISVKVGRLIAN